METGRPVLVAPSSVPARIGARPAVAWRATVPGVHALHGALPMLTAAEHVPVITVDEGGGATPGDVVRYLAFHGVRGEAQTINAGGREAGNAILDAASAANADMLVMGAYAHSRLRQFILGGVTSTVLRQAALPLVLAH
jgi:nucleotide-binding universal stress UspA family protein